MLLLGWAEVSLQILPALHDFHGGREGQEGDAEGRTWQEHAGRETP